MGSEVPLRHTPPSPTRVQWVRNPPAYSNAEASLAVSLVSKLQFILSHTVNDLFSYLTSGKRAHNYIVYQDVHILGYDVKMDTFIYRSFPLKKENSYSSVRISSAFNTSFYLNK